MVRAKVGEGLKYKNFYETLDEAHRRLLNTVVTYDGEPGRIVAITNHKPDGIFRVYWWPARCEGKAILDRLDHYGHGTADQAAYLDKWIETHKDADLQRKQMNSPKFNKFRPFPLGMLNKTDGLEGYCYYLERSPERRTYQGLVRSGVESTLLSLRMKKKGPYPYSLTGQEFVDCVRGVHPSAEEVLENMLDPSNANHAVACHRYFAIIRGPLDTFFLAYKNSAVGFVPRDKRPQVELGAKFAHLRETLEETNQFRDIRIR